MVFVRRFFYGGVYWRAAIIRGNTVHVYICTIWLSDKVHMCIMLLRLKRGTTAFVAGDDRSSSLLETW